MLKNIKLFSTDSDRTTYESSASYETPYVSKVAADNSVHYNIKPKTIILLTIGDTDYQAEEGMTWGEWCNSSYNTDGYHSYPYEDYRIVDSTEIYEVSSAGDPVYSSTIIEEVIVYDLRAITINE